MNDPDGPPLSISQVDRATIRHVNAKADVALVSDKRVAIFKTTVRLKRSVNDRDVVAMDLLSSGKDVSLQPQHVPGTPMHLVEIGKHGSFVLRQLDARNPPHKSVRKTERIQRVKPLDRQTAIFHLTSCWW